MTTRRAKALSLVQLAETQVGKPYVFGARVDFTDPDPKAFDCAEFATWLVYQTTGALYGVTDAHADPQHADAYSGAWLDWSRLVGTRIRVDEAAAIAGAFVVRAPGPGKIGHVAMVADGLGGTIEAHSTRVGVARRMVSGRRWDCGVLVPGVDYFAASRPAPIAVTMPYVLRRGSRGTGVATVQELLGEIGHDVGPVDGIFGERTERAVAAFQRARGLVPDGEVGELTRAALGIG